MPPSPIQHTTPITRDKITSLPQRHAKEPTPSSKTDIKGQPDTRMEVDDVLDDHSEATLLSGRPPEIIKAALVEI